MPSFSWFYCLFLISVATLICEKKLLAINFQWTVSNFCLILFPRILIDFFICRFLFDESCSDYKYYEYRLSEEQKALPQIGDSQPSRSGWCLITANLSIMHWCSFEWWSVHLVLKLLCSANGNGYLMFWGKPYALCTI